MSQKLIEYLVGLGLYFIPLYSIKDGKCTCAKPDCSSPGKHPLLHFNWKIIATKDIEKINKWREKNKYLNFAVATGRRSTTTEKYLVVVDVDAEEHEFIKQMPVTFAYKTGAGGYHYWFWSKYPIKNSVSLVAKKVDIRGTNGYVVIPPSKHASGLNYKLLYAENQEIVDIPKFIYDLIRSKRNEAENLKKTHKKTKLEITKLVKEWSQIGIPAIRDRFDAHEKIPKGVRNVVCFRLLCSDRARGTTELHMLINNAKYYRAFFEESESFTDAELESIAKSVMKYPAYNNCHEKVNDCYFKWLENNGTKVDEKYKLQLNFLDELFFTKCLSKTDGVKGNTISLKSIAEAREKFLKANDMLVFSSYKSQLLAKKLEQLGFKKVRSAKGNTWALEIKV